VPREATEDGSLTGTTHQDGRIGRMGQQREHREHQAGTVSGCWHCTKVAYEPSWYASLLTFSQGRDDALLAGTQTVGS